jgi:hypothetical protein
LLFIARVSKILFEFHGGKVMLLNSNSEEANIINLNSLLDLKERRVNNTSVKRQIFRFIFDRDEASLVNLVINYRGKVRDILSHALGNGAIVKILSSKNEYKKVLKKYTNFDCVNIVNHLYGKPIDFTRKRFEKIDHYYALRHSAVNNKIEDFKSEAMHLPFEVVLGFRNTFKLPFSYNDIKEISICSQIIVEEVISEKYLQM